METCTRCRETKPLSDFPLNKRKKNGLSSWCRVCHRESALPINPGLHMNQGFCTQIPSRVLACPPWTNQRHPATTGAFRRRPSRLTRRCAGMADLAALEELFTMAGCPS